MLLQVTIRSLTGRGIKQYVLVFLVNQLTKENLLIMDRNHIVINNLEAIRELRDLE